MNRRTATRTIPGLLLATLVLAGCCNENWKGVGTVSGTLTISGTWDIGEIDAIKVETIDACENKYIHFAARAGDGLEEVLDALQATGTYAVDLEEQEVIAGKTLTRWMVRDTSTFKSLFETRWSEEYKLKKNGSQTLTITYTFPE